MNDCDSQGECKVTLEERYEIANDLLTLPYLQDEAIAKKTKLTVDEIETLRRNS